jgi:hypothetical protein
MVTLGSSTLGDVSAVAVRDLALYPDLRDGGFEVRCSQLSDVPPPG